MNDVIQLGNFFLNSWKSVPSVMHSITFLMSIDFLVSFGISSELSQINIKASQRDTKKFIGVSFWWNGILSHYFAFFFS